MPTSSRPANITKEAEKGSGLLIGVDIPSPKKSSIAGDSTAPKVARTRGTQRRRSMPLFGKATSATALRQLPSLGLDKQEPPHQSCLNPARPSVEPVAEYDRSSFEFEESEKPNKWWLPRNKTKDRRKSERAWIKQRVLSASKPGNFLKKPPTNQRASDRADMDSSHSTLLADLSGSLNNEEHCSREDSKMSSTVFVDKKFPVRFPGRNGVPDRITNIIEC